MQMHGGAKQPRPRHRWCECKPQRTIVALYAGVYDGAGRDVEHVTLQAVPVVDLVERERLWRLAAIRLRVADLFMGSADAACGERECMHVLNAVGQARESRGACAVPPCPVAVDGACRLCDSMLPAVETSSLLQRHCHAPPQQLAPSPRPRPSLTETWPWSTFMSTMRSRPSAFSLEFSGRHRTTT